MTGERSPLLLPGAGSTPRGEPQPPPSPPPLATPLFPFHPAAPTTPLWRKLLLLFFDGHRRVTRLRERDIWPLEPQFQGARAAADLKKHIPVRGRWRLLRAVCGVNARRILTATALRVVSVVFTVARPLLLYHWLRTTDKHGYRHELTSLVGVALLKCGVAFAMCHSHEIDMRVFWQTYSALYAMITDRITAVGSLAATSDAVNTTAVPSGATGFKQRLTEITKMLVNDLEAIGESIVTAISAWAAVIKLVVSVVVLLRVVTVPNSVLWSSVAVFAAFAVVTVAISSPLARRAESSLLFRLNTVHECLKGIQMVKLNAWEDKMETKILQARSNEQVAANRLGALLLLTQLLTNESPMLIATVVFGASAWQTAQGDAAALASSEQKPFTPARVFVTLLLLGDCLQHARYLNYAFDVLLKGHGAWGRVERLILDDSAGPRSSNVSPKTTFPLLSSTVVVEMSGVCLSSPQNSSSTPTLLINVNWRVHQGELVVVHGAAGLGKSMLLGAIREDPSVVQLLQGSARPVSPNCRIAFCSQDPWLQSVSIRDNILFGTDFNENKYWTVIDACGLLEDLAALPAGDATLVGPRGINLSSGQCARIALARACYADADLYLLDCPLANVDPVVQSQIFRKCIVELLMFKTVVIVTHNPEYIGSTYVDQLVHVQPLSVRVTNRSSKRKLQETNPQPVSRRLRDHQRSLAPRALDDHSLSLMALSNDAVRLIDQISSSSEAASRNVQDDCTVHALSSQAAFYQLYEAHHGYAVMCVVLTALLGTAFFARDLLIMIWAGESLTQQQSSGARAEENERAMITYMYLAVTCIVLGLAARGCIAMLCSQLSGKLFTTMTHAVLHSPMTLFYHTPIGETINRYYSDVMVVDEILPASLSLFALSIVSFSSRILIVGWVLGPLGVLILVVGYSAATQSLSIPFVVETIVVQLHIRGKLLSLMSEVVDGETVIRAFGNQRALHVFRALESVSDMLKRTSIFILAFNSSIILHGDLMIAALIIALLGLVAYQDLTPTAHGLILLNIFMLQQEIISRFSTGLVNTVIGFSSVGRLLEYGSLQTEVEVHSSTHLFVLTSTVGRPQHGYVQFENVDFSYPSVTLRKTDNFALRNVSFSLRGGENVGVIGRTGSGKSSLAMALLRIHPLRSGRILLDGVDLRTVPLTQLRRSFTMIPQSPTFYRCSIRDYLDPFHEFDDARLWRELLTLDLGTRVQSLDDELLDNGENWSLGQRQLLCFARALLRPSRVVVLDEAFSCVAQSCQEKVLSILRDRFASSTVILITHRLDQILEFDRILVMQEGRLVESGSASELASQPDSVFYEFLETSLLTF